MESTSYKVTCIVYSKSWLLLLPFNTRQVSIWPNMLRLFRWLRNIFSATTIIYFESCLLPRTPFKYFLNQNTVFPLISVGPHYMKQIQKEILLSSFIISHFNYCLLIWMFCSKKSIKKINDVFMKDLYRLFEMITSLFTPYY